MKYPFPGINPWMEQHWPDVHTRLLTGLADQLAERLPGDLAARTEEALTIEDDGTERAARADVAITESWREGRPPVWKPSHEGTAGGIIADPVLVTVEAETQRWLEIRHRDGRLITAIEILSPSNKRRGPGHQAYLERQAAYLAGPANLVEIDLLRGGREATRIPRSLLGSRAAGDVSLVCVSREGARQRVEAYVFPLRQPILPFRVPLRAEEADVVVELQPLIERCYRSGRYWQLDYSRPLDPPLSPEDAAWAEECLRQAGLR